MAMKRKGTNGRNVGAFPLDTKLSKTARIAAFLDYWAENHPYDFAAYNEVLKAIEGYSSLPRLENKEVDRVRSNCSGASRILRERYSRELVRHPGLGVRATVDAMDAIRHVQTKKMARVESAVKQVSAVDDNIDLKSIPDTAENRPLKDWYKRDVKGILKQIASPEMLSRMLPPAPPDEAGS